MNQQVQSKLPTDSENTTKKIKIKHKIFQKIYVKKL